MDRAKFIQRSKLADRSEWVLSRIPGMEVLHIGMGGYIDDLAQSDKFIARGLEQSLHAKISRTAKRSVGLDINPDMITVMSAAVPGDYHVGDIMDPALPAVGQFDLVLLLDVIEHLDCFHTALANIRRLLKPTGRLAISTINAFSAEAALKMIFHYEMTHAEHTCYFSPLTLKRTLEMSGYRVKSFGFHMNMPDRLISRLLRPATRLFPQFAPGIHCLASPV